MRSLAQFVLAAIPVVMLLGGSLFANRIEPRILGLPFLMVWLVVWVLSIPLFLIAVERLRKPA